MPVEEVAAERRELGGVLIWEERARAAAGVILLTRRVRATNCGIARALIFASRASRSEASRASLRSVRRCWRATNTAACAEDIVALRNALAVVRCIRSGERRNAASAGFVARITRDEEARCGGGVGDAAAVVSCCSGSSRERAVVAEVGDWIVACQCGEFGGGGVRGIAGTTRGGNVVGSGGGGTARLADGDLIRWRRACQRLQ